MANHLSIALGQCSGPGRKEINQDFHGAIVPQGHELATKGIAIAISDGISSSEVSHIASESAVKSFLADYYCTSAAWTVKTSASRVIAATNPWLHAQNQRGIARYDRDKGYVCTFSAIVLKSATAHLFHVGDARIYRLSGTSLEQLTNDHRVAVSAATSYLGRALGVQGDVEIDYRAVAISPGDVFVLATDGVYAHVSADGMAEAIASGTDLNAIARGIVDDALKTGGEDDLTVQIVRIVSLPQGEPVEVMELASDLRPAPLLEAGGEIDGYRIARTLHASSRSHAYLAEDKSTGSHFVLKIPSIDKRDDAEYLRRFMMEEWAARRINSPHVLRAVDTKRAKTALFVAMEYVDGVTLAQWMRDNPKPDLESVRGIIEQIAKGLRAFHRLEMLHQDVRPENIMIDRSGTVKIIDFGSVKIAGVMEASPAAMHGDHLGTPQYTAPEYILGESGTPLSDLFGLGVIAYQMLTGRLPYGARMAQAQS
ncbi:MAG: protein kinase, partial [Hyphomicrobiaceae bacterium]